MLRARDRSGWLEGEVPILLFPTSAALRQFRVFDKYMFGESQSPA
jgi:hypothetical protein